jgi:hypothetical protein
VQFPLHACSSGEKRSLPKVLTAVHNKRRSVPGKLHFVGK